MSQFSFLDVLDATAAGPSIVSEQHSQSRIKVDTSAAPGEWDASEYGMTREAFRAQWNAAATPEEKDRVKRNLIQAAVRRASLANVNGKVAFIGRRGDDIWHELGTIVDAAMTVEDVFRLAPHLDVTYSKEPVYVQFGDGGGFVIAEKFGVMMAAADGSKAPLPNTVVGNRWTPVQPRESLKFLDAALGANQANFETVGLIHDGRQMFVTARQPQVAEPVLGDEVHSFMGLVDYYDGTGATRWFSCANRSVCANTTRINLRDGQPYASFRHTASIKAKLDASARAFRDATQRFAEFAEKAEQMTRTPVVPAHYANDVLDCVLDITAADAKKGASALAAVLDVTEAERELAAKSFARKIKKRGEVLDDILDRHESETNTAPGTLWGAYNAVTEHANHGMGYRGKAKQVQRFDSILTGKADQVNQAALEQAIAVMA